MRNDRVSRQLQGQQPLGVAFRKQAAPMTAVD
jgi:hypothetical protein